MFMSEEEICREYHTARDRRKQIQILADLNTTDRKSIIEILLRGGEKVDGRLLGKREKAADTPSPACGDTIPSREKQGKEDPAGPDTAPGENQGTDTHTHTAGGTPDETPKEYITVGELLDLLREVPAECRVQIGDEPLAGYVWSKGYNALSGESMSVLSLV